MPNSTATRRELLDKLYQGQEPFADEVSLDRVDPQGWASDHPYLTRAVDEVRPNVVVEVGVWKGGSVATLARRMKELQLDGAVIAVDTWLGAFDHWLSAEWFSHLRFERGYPTIYQTFRANMVSEGVEGYVLPMPLDSVNAGHVLRHNGVFADIVHIDGAHDYQSVMADLSQWWTILRPGGILIGDDYHASGPTWPEVRRAFQDFFKTDQIENINGKCYIRRGA